MKHNNALNAWKTPAIVDAIIVLAVFLALLSAAVAIDAFEYVTHLSAEHESWQLDEYLTALMFMPIALSVYAARRLIEVRKELRRRIAAERAARQMALHDPMTGLPNRRKAMKEIQAALTRADVEPVTLLAVDLNRFKPVNDLHGHAAGDQLLLAVGKRLGDAAGPKALVGRLGGDEFCVMLTGLPFGDGLIAKVEHISAAFDKPFLLDSVSVTVGASIGVVNTNSATMQPDELMSQADAAMYRGKASARNGVSFFEAGMEHAALRRAEIEVDLRIAIATGHIEPYFQPLVHMGTGQIMGFEALARWRLPDGSLRLPEEFIAIAEETGLITELFFSILRASALKAKEWPADIHFAVNLSPVQFGDEWLVERILQVLLEVGVAPGRLEIEITESALVADIDVAREVILSLKNQGIQVSLDDFGTGYSSLRHLSELPFDKLKIDRSFVHDIETNAASQQIVRAITALAHNLGLQVTAEGIETLDNAANIQTYGCDIGQGYLYGRPSDETALVMSSQAANHKPDNIDTAADRQNMIMPRGKVA